MGRVIEAVLFASPCESAHLYIIIIFLIIIIVGLFIISRKQVMQQQERLEDQKHMREIAEQANLSKTRFLSSISHEIRTPMNVIIGLTQITSKKIDDKDKVKENLIRIEAASKHLLSLINDVLDMSKIETEDYTINSEEINLRRVLEDIHDIYENRAIEDKIEFVLNVDDNVPEYIISDDLRLTQAISNLLGNAIKFTQEQGRIELNVYILENNIDELCVEVIDNGIGIDIVRQDILFDAFVQANNNITREYGGTGLGLSITKGIVERMRGNIGVESELEKGSRFYFVIPIVRGSGNNGGASSIVENRNYDFSGRCIILAEDIEINSEIIEVFLEDTNINIEKVENGKEAVRLFEEQPEKYSAILMDIQMPIMDGLEATRKIRAMDTEVARNIPIIAMTANAFAEDVTQCMEAGMNGHIAKPVDANVILNKLNEYIG